MNKQAIRILSLALVLAASSPVVFAQKVWKGSWATAVEWTGKGDMPKESLSNRSCRQVVHVSFGGEELRVKLSNEQSKEPVEIKSVYIADTDKNSNWFVNAPCGRNPAERSRLRRIPCNRKSRSPERAHDVFVQAL